MRAAVRSRRVYRAACAAVGLAAVALIAVVLASAVAAGPPFPSPVTGQRVYDTAGIFDQPTISKAAVIIAGIEARTGAQVAVYTQPVEYGVSTAEAESQARALMDQWGVGRKGFDDGLVILYDIDPRGCHGQVQLYAGAGFRSTFLSDAERQAVYQDEMLPLLKDCRLGESLLAALAAVDGAATPAHAASLDRARLVDAIIGLVGAPLVFLLLLGWVVNAWLRHGRDPVYLDDPSIHMPAPPTDLTPATGALVFDGRSSRHTLTTALLDLASRGEVTFVQDEGGLLKTPKVGMFLGADAPDDPKAAWSIEKARRAPTGPAEAFALKELHGIAGSGKTIEPDDLPKFGEKSGEFDDALETHAVAKGWFTERPKAAANRWYLRGGLEAGVGILAMVVGFNVPMAGLVLLGGAVLVAAVVTLILAISMPSRTLAGAMIRAMLAAYRRTLEKTMAQARSMDQVVEEAGIPWLETPDQAFVWATALGLAAAAEGVLKRSLDDVRDGRIAASGVYVPFWYVPAGSSGGGGVGWFGGGSGGGGAFSSSPVPNIGGMMAVIGTIGSTPSSGGGGGFGGGGGGGGGGAGGGF